jgi:uncharacterized protein YbjT (DUF2867 family)
MNILVLGANGKTGRLVVEQALAAGHTVKAFVRDPSKLKLSDERPERSGRCDQHHRWR